MLGPLSEAGASTSRTAPCSRPRAPPPAATRAQPARRRPASSGAPRATRPRLREVLAAPRSSPASLSHRSACEEAAVGADTRAKYGEYFAAFSEFCLPHPVPDTIGALQVKVLEMLDCMMLND